MRLALDARSMQAAPRGGIGRGLASLLPHLAGPLDVSLLTAAEAPPIPDSGPGVSQHALATPWPGLGTGWLQRSAPSFLRGFDGIFHCPFYALPVRQPVPMVVTIHDLTFEHHPGWFRPGQAWAFRRQARWAARTAKVVITPSETVATDLVTTYGTSRDRILVAPNSVSEDFSDRRDPSATLAAFGVETSYFLALGGAARRNVTAAIEAWRTVRVDTPIDLVIVGGTTADSAPARSVGRVTDGEWADLLTGATALIYPTEYEGFGMPALEAAASGTPVVCAPVGSLPEVLGDAAIWCDRPDAASIADGMRRALDIDTAADISAAGLALVAAHPSWSTVADLYLDAYRRAHDG